MSETLLGREIVWTSEPFDNKPEGHYVMMSVPTPGDSPELHHAFKAVTGRTATEFFDEMLEELNMLKGYENKAIVQSLGRGVANLANVDKGRTVEDIEAECRKKWGPGEIRLMFYTKEDDDGRE